MCVTWYCLQAQRLNGSYDHCYYSLSGRSGPRTQSCIFLRDREAPWDGTCPKGASSRHSRAWGLQVWRGIWERDTTAVPRAKPTRPSPHLCGYPGQQWTSGGGFQALRGTHWPVKSTATHRGPLGSDPGCLRSSRDVRNKLGCLIGDWGSHRHLKCRSPSPCLERDISLAFKKADSRHPRESQRKAQPASSLTRLQEPLSHCRDTPQLLSVGLRLVQPPPLPRVRPPAPSTLRWGQGSEQAGHPAAAQVPVQV